MNLTQLLSQCGIRKANRQKLQYKRLLTRKSYTNRYRTCRLKAHTHQILYNTEQTLNKAKHRVWIHEETVQGDTAVKTSEVTGETDELIRIMTCDMRTGIQIQW